jgi:hypothetical protein
VQLPQGPPELLDFRFVRELLAFGQFQPLTSSMSSRIGEGYR